MAPGDTLVTTPRLAAVVAGAGVLLPPPPPHPARSSDATAIRITGRPILELVDLRNVERVDIVLLLRVGDGLEGWESDGFWGEWERDFCQQDAGRLGGIAIVTDLKGIRAGIVGRCRHAMENNSIVV
jgi:hypothetical protein